MKYTRFWSFTQVIALLMSVLVLLSGCGSNATKGGTDKALPVVVGSLLDLTGGLNIYGTAMFDATKYAIDDINKSGGVLGRQLDLKNNDTQSANETYNQYATQLVLRDKAEVIMGGITSASREAIRPITDRNKTIYFYNEQYEGGVADKLVFNTGVVPEQQLSVLIKWAKENVGSKFYVLAADYNYGQISEKWVEKYLKDNNAILVGKDFVPLDVTDFGSINNKIQEAKPDVVVSLLVGGSHMAFYRQFAAAGLNKKMKIVSATFGLGNEQVVVAPEEAEGIVVAYPYFQELDNPVNKSFVNEWHKRYGDNYPYITDSASAVWNGWHLWAKAVNKAGSLEQSKVLAALESGIEYNAPSGKVTLDPQTHHLIQNISIAKANRNHGFDLIKTYESVVPVWHQSVMDLVKKPDTNTQFMP